MKKFAQYLLRVVMFFGVLGLFLSCLDALNFDGNTIKVDVNLNGNINTTDVTAAVLLLTNQSKTVDVTRVIISQRIDDNSQQVDGEDETDIETPDTVSSAPTTVISFENEPKRLTKKAKYLTPSETSYIISIEYKYYHRGGMPDEFEGEGVQEITVPLPLPGKIVEVFIYRDVSGEVKIGTERDLTYDQSDTGSPVDDHLVGQGSSPAVIPPENRDKMATFVVVNRTKSQVIDSIRFEMGQSAYTMGAVKIRDKQSIALGQGTWGTTVTYGGVKLLSVNSIIVPSSDPQAAREHYLYFYLNNTGQYCVTGTWPPGDESAEDILPLDRGFGRGVIKVINLSDSQVSMVTITNLNNGESRGLDSAHFEPPVPVLRNRTGYLDLVGTADFPIEDHGDYRVDITVEAGSRAVTVTRQTSLKDVVVEIIIEPGDIPPRNVPPGGDEEGYGQGAIRIVNQSDSVVNNLTITSLGGNAGERVIAAAEFDPPGPVGRGGDARVAVDGNAAFPIDGGEYLIVITLEVGGSPHEITRQARIKDTNAVIIIRPGDIDSVAPPPPTTPLADGIIRIVNQSDSPVNSLTINSLVPPQELRAIGCEDFAPPVPVGQYQHARIDIFGNASFPADGVEYAIKVTVNSGAVVTKNAVIKGAHVVIVIKPEDIVDAITTPSQPGPDGVISVINQTNSRVNSVTIKTLNNSQLTTIGFSRFDPPVPVDQYQNARVDVFATAEFPIDGGEYLIEAAGVTLAGDPFTVQKQAVIKDAHVVIIITAIPPPQGFGRGTIIINNESNAGVTKVTITSSGGGSLDIPLSRFDPTGPIWYNKTARVEVTGTAAFPIADGVTYTIEVAAEGGDGAFTDTRYAAFDHDVVITIKPEVVYAAGWYQHLRVNYYNDVDEESRQRACYWVNGKRMILGLPYGTSNNEADSRGEAIAVAGGSVYVAGWYIERVWISAYGGSYYDNILKACYWVDGLPVSLHPPLSEPSFISRATGIAVSPDGTVYVSGWYVDYTASYDIEYKACYWEIRSTTDITLHTLDLNNIDEARANGIAVSSGTIYIAGWYMDEEDWIHKAYYAEIQNGTQVIHRLDPGPPPPGGYGYGMDSYATGIALSDGRVYVSGLYETGSEPWPCYWIDGGAAYPLETSGKGGDGTEYRLAAGIAAAGGRFYTACYSGQMYDLEELYNQSSYDYTTPGYWDGSVFKPLPILANEINSNTFGITVSRNGNVYTAGYYGVPYNNFYGERDNSHPGTLTACYWINRDNPIPLDVMDSEARAIILGPPLP